MHAPAALSAERARAVSLPQMEVVQAISVTAGGAHTRQQSQQAAASITAHSSAALLATPMPHMAATAPMPAIVRVASKDPSALEGPPAQPQQQAQQAMQSGSSAMDTSGSSGANEQMHAVVDEFPPPPDAHMMPPPATMPLKMDTGAAVAAGIDGLTRGGDGRRKSQSMDALHPPHTQGFFAHETSSMMPPPQATSPRMLRTQQQQQAQQPGHMRTHTAPHQQHFMYLQSMHDARGTPPQGLRRVSEPPPSSHAAASHASSSLDAGGAASSSDHYLDRELTHSDGPHLVQGINSPFLVSHAHLSSGAGGMHAHELSPDPLRSSAGVSMPSGWTGSHSSLYGGKTMEMQQRATGGYNMSAASSRRSSVTKLADTDDEGAHELGHHEHEHDLASPSRRLSQPSGAFGQLVLGGTSSSHPSVNVPLSGMASLSSQLTPTSSSAAGSAPSSVPTSPMRRFSFTTSWTNPTSSAAAGAGAASATATTSAKFTTTLVPSPRMAHMQAQSKLQSAGRREAARRAAHSKDSMHDDSEDEDDEGQIGEGAVHAAAAMSSAEDERKRAEEGGFTPPSSAASSPAARASKKRSSDSGPLTPAEQLAKRRRHKKKTGRPTALLVSGEGGEGGVAAADDVGAAAKTLARFSRRRSVPPLHFDELDEKTQLQRQRERASTHPLPSALSSAAAAAGAEDGFAATSGSEYASASSSAATSAANSPRPKLEATFDCEACHRKHTGEYGGGRFCSSKCARHFSIMQRWGGKHRG